MPPVVAFNAFNAFSHDGVRDDHGRPVPGTLGHFYSLDDLPVVMTVALKYLPAKGFQKRILLDSKEIGEAMEFMDGREGFLQRENSGHYYGPEKQYVGIGNSNYDQIQVQNAKPDVILGLIKILKPEFYQTDTQSSEELHPIWELINQNEDSHD